MRISHHNCKDLAGQRWYMLELRNEGTVEGIIRRVCEEIPGIFKGHPIELFVPVGKRDLRIYELLSGPFVYIRSSNFDCLCRLRNVTGVVGLVTKGYDMNVRHALTVEDSFVQELMKQTKAEFRARSRGIRVGSFVRILDSFVRDLCGTVEVVDGTRAVVRIEMKTKKVLVDTPLLNLLNLDHVPPEKRVFYWCDLLDDIDSALVENDLHSVPATHESVPEPASSTVPRRSGATRVIRGLVAQGKSPRRVAEEAAKEMLPGGMIIKAPKNIHIIYGILKNEFLAKHKRYKNWRETLQHLPANERLDGGTMQEILIAAGVNIPLWTPEERVSKDGRSKEARRKKKAAARGR